MTDVSGVLASAMKEHRAGRLVEAEGLYQQVLDAEPHRAEAWHLRGLVAVQAGQIQAGVEYIQRAVDLRPDFVEALYNLGVILERSDRLEEAACSYRRALEIAPTSAVTFVNLGNVLNRLRNGAEAIDCYRRAVALEPQSAGWHYNLGLALQAADAVAEAVVCYRQAIALRPDLVQGHNNLGAMLIQQGELDAAEAYLRDAARLDPNSAEAFQNLGIVWRRMARLEESNAALHRAVDINPDFRSVQSDLLYGLYFVPGYDAAAIYAEHRLWNERRAQSLAKFTQPHSNDRSTGRRLRVGYFSSEFREHCQSFFMIPLLTHHDRAHFEIFCYSGTVQADHITNRVRTLADHWREIAGMSAEEAAEMVRQDAIDIFVDLVLHMGGGRPSLFARKPAPVQACWLGYPGTTGLTAIDYRISDPYLDPPGMFEQYCSEETVRLPHSFWCYDPLADGPEVGELPTLKKGYVTFGCLNNFCKVNEGILRLWGRVMRFVERSRLMLLAPEGSARERVWRILMQEGVTPARVQFVPYQSRADYLKTYQQIDIGLETLPANGHTTSLDAFWMGVPVPTIVGQTVVGRAGVSLLQNLGLSELIAQTPEEYVRVVSELAGDWERLAALRAGLRQRMEGSPLMDGRQFARDMEEVYRGMWRRWCKGLDDEY